MSGTLTYEPKYSGSHALVIGINKYKHGGPLAFAVNDAKAVASVLVERFGFPDVNVELLLDSKATKAAILQRYLQLTKPEKVDHNDRVLMFFAGHGHTELARRETGFLVPVDGDVDDLSTLIRWDELTRNADLVLAKHVLFIMDACYGGLAVTRKSIKPGTSRFLENMLVRFSRQVITAGKGDEVVSDGNGTRPHNSIFTSHLLDALEGAAATTSGVTTAMSVMAYVYDKVGKDTHSQQTPHFGYIDGDGDFVFEMPEAEAPTVPEGGSKGTVVQLPEVKLPDTLIAPTVGEQVKALLPNEADQIRLHDLVVRTLRKSVDELSPSNFPSQLKPGMDVKAEFVERIGRYEGIMGDIEPLVIQLGMWAKPDQLRLIERVFATLGELSMPTGGLVNLLRLCWYPVTIALYACGISALAAGRYDALHTCLFTVAKTAQDLDGKPRPIIDSVVNAMTGLHDQFKWLPGAERQYAPRSEHMLSALQPIIEDELYLGKRYEEYFDFFEIMLALSFGDKHAGLTTPFWGPPGRFAWKEASPVSGGQPFSAFVSRALEQGDAWPALRAGFFNGSKDRFAEVAEGYRQLINKLNWW